MKAPYNFHDLRRDCRKSPLPEDVNARAEDLVKKAMNGAPDLLEALKVWREKKLFGTVTHFGEVEINGHKTLIEAARFEFEWGVCRLIHVRKPVGRLTVEERTIKNDSVNFANKPTAGKPANTPTEEKHG